MDPVICCLLGICCPPAERRQKVGRYVLRFVKDKAVAQAVADDLIARIDRSHLGTFLKNVVDAVKRRPR